MACAKASVALACVLALGSELILCESKRTLANDAPTAKADKAAAWNLIEEDAFCGKDIRKDLGAVTSVDECSSRAVADADCGHQLHTNGLDTCMCVTAGEECDFQESKAGSAVYQKEVRVVDVSWAANSQAFQIDARCCCNKHKGWKDHFRKETGICIIVRHTDTCSKSSKGLSSYLGELKRKTMHNHLDTDDELCEIPEDHAQDIIDEFGPAGCGAFEIEGDNMLTASVGFTKFGEKAEVTCPFGTTTNDATVTCGTNGVFSPTPGCHGE